MNKKSTAKKSEGEKVAVLGPEGSYSHAAFLKYGFVDKAGKKCAPVFYDSIPFVLEAVAKGKVSRAIVPFENSIHGTVLETLDGLYYKKLSIGDELVLDVRHCIAGISKKIEAKNIKTIYSHPQALGQCAKYILKHYKNAKTVPTLSTAAAFQMIHDKKPKDALAVGPLIGANIYNLAVIAESIQDEKNNQTLFVVVGKDAAFAENKNTLLVIDPMTDKPGLLYQILGIFAERKINLLKLESRPSRTKLGAYIFYIKTAARRNDADLTRAIAELKKFGKVAVI